MISTLLYYIFYASVILWYGIGVFDEILFSKKQFLKILISFISVFATIALSYLIGKNVLIPSHLLFFAPLVAFIVFLFIAALLKLLIDGAIQFSRFEFSVSFLVVLLSIFEGGHLVTALFIALSSLVPVFALFPFLHSFTKRIENIKAKNETNARWPLMLLLLSIIALAFVSWNISPFAGGVR